MICQICHKDWSVCGKQYQSKTNSRKFYYKCTCGSKRRPVDFVEDDIKDVVDDRQHKGKRVLVIPDTHFPFAKKGYLEFLKEVYAQYNCDTVVHLGDIMDNHYSSFHDSDPDGHGASDELVKAMDCIRELHDAFPIMTITMGNHDLIPNRKAFSTGLSNTWIKSIKDVIVDYGIPVHGWKFVDHIIIDDVSYSHGVGRQAKNRMMQDMISVVQGHWHSRSSVDWIFNNRVRLFAVQLGALIEDDAYAFAYAKHFAKSFKNCGVIINGEIPIIIPMNL